jgi:hypothetical protein
MLPAAGLGDVVGAISPNFAYLMMFSIALRPLHELYKHLQVSTRFVLARVAPVVLPAYLTTAHWGVYGCARWVLKTRVALLHDEATSSPTDLLAFRQVLQELEKNMSFWSCHPLHYPPTSTVSQSVLSIREAALDAQEKELSRKEARVTLLRSEIEAVNTKHFQDVSKRTDAINLQLAAAHKEVLTAIKDAERRLVEVQGNNAGEAEDILRSMKVLAKFASELVKHSSRKD